MSDRPANAALAVPPSAKPRILLLAQYLGSGRGGGELSILALMRRLADRGFDIHVAYVRDADPAAPLDEPWLTKHLMGDNRMAGLRNVLLRVAPSLVVSDAAVAAMSTVLCRDLGFPTLALVQFWRGLIRMEQAAFDAVHAGDVPPELQDAEGLAELSRASAIVANSDFTAERVTSLLGRAPVAVVFPTISPDCVARNAPPLDERDTVVCPSVQPGKGSLVFLDLAERNPGVRFLLLAGDNVHSREDKVVRRARGLANVTVREDWVSDMAWVYAQARVMFIGTTTCETFCRAAAEARANGVPILAHDSGHLSRIAATGGVVVRRGATLDEWQAGLDQALALRPAPSLDWIRDDGDRFIAVVNGTRRLDEVTLLKPGARGVSQGCAHFNRVLGCRVAEFPCQPRALDGAALVVMCGFYDAKWAEARKGPLAVWWCSHLAQSDTSRHEVTGLLDVVKAFTHSPGRWLALTSLPDASLWGRVKGLNVAWLPNCMSGLDATPSFSRAPGRRVFIVGHYDVRKNAYTAVAAAALAGAEIHLTALARKAPDLVELGQALGAQVVVHDCASVEDVRSVAASCNAAVAVSSAETYCYAAAEAVAAGTPCVTWRGIPALRGSPKALVVSDPSDLSDVSDALDRALADGPGLAEAQFTVLRDRAADYNFHARAAMRGMLDV